MKNHFIILLILISMSEQIIGQKAMPRFEELKAWKLSYITSNTSMNSRELEVYKCIFEEYENTYHDEIWIKVREMRKELKNSIETIPTEKAASYINVFDEYEKKGMQMKHKRNERLLKKIRPKVVLNILYQEKRFDRELFKRIKDKTKKDK